MRYENWDILLFPGASKVPIQEFKTQCFVTRDRESPYLRSPALDPIPYFRTQNSVGLLPVLTTFIPSLKQNTPFRVSIHSWEKPQPSRVMESLLQPDDILLFEIRVFVDAVCVSGSVFSQRASWPHVMDLSSYVDKSGNQDSLRFPTFHPEILEQRHWDAADLFGRIRVVLSEGLSRPNRSPPFERVRNIVSFAFQHAPLEVLEGSNIAWPNSSMWTREAQLFKYVSGDAHSEKRDPDDTPHAHSPCKDGLRQIVVTNNFDDPPMPGSLSYGNSYNGPVPQVNTVEPSWRGPLEPLMPDPFIDSYVLDPAVRHHGARPSWEDVSMPDYVPSSNGSRALSAMTGISYEHSKHSSLVNQIDEESYSQLIEALSPPKPLSYGIHAPRNTPSSNLPISTKPSAAAEARSASYPKSGSRSSIFKDASQSSTWEIPETSAKLNILTETNGPINATSGKHHASPSTHVRGKKERLSQDSKTNDAAVETQSRENDKVSIASSKVATTKNDSMDTPIGDKKKKSIVSARERSASLSKGEIVLLSPAQDLTSIADHVRQAGCDDDLRNRLADSSGEVANID